MTAARLRSLTANHGILAASEVRFVLRTEVGDVPVDLMEHRVDGAERDAEGSLKLKPGTLPTLVLVLVPVGGAS